MKKEQKPTNNDSQSLRLRPHNYGLFMVTEEVFHETGDGKMTCLTSGEVLDKKEWIKRGNGTWLKVSPSP